MSFNFFRASSYFVAIQMNQSLHGLIHLIIYELARSSVIQRAHACNRNRTPIRPNITELFFTHISRQISNSDPVSRMLKLRNKAVLLSLLLTTRTLYAGFQLLVAACNSATIAVL